MRPSSSTACRRNVRLTSSGWRSSDVSGPRPNGVRWPRPWRFSPCSARWPFRRFSERAEPSRRRARACARKERTSPRRTLPRLWKRFRKRRSKPRPRRACATELPRDAADAAAATELRCGSSRPKSRKPSAKLPASARAVWASLPRRQEVRCYGIATSSEIRPKSFVASLRIGTAGRISAGFRHGDLRSRLGESVSPGGEQSALDLLDRCRHGLVFERPPFHQLRLAPAQGCGAGGRDDQLFQLRLSRTGRRQAVLDRSRCHGVPLGCESSPAADRIEGPRGGERKTGPRAIWFSSSMSRAR